MKKKSYLFVILCCLFLMLPSNVFALSEKEAAKKMNEYMDKAVFGKTWKVSDYKWDGYYQVKVLVGNTSDKKFKEVIDQLPTAGLPIIANNNYKSYVTIYACEPNTSKCESGDNIAVPPIQFSALVADKNGDVYLSDEVEIDTYKKIIAAKYVYYTIKSNQKWIGGDIKITGSKELNKKGSTDESSVDKTPGKQTNPIVIKDKGSITLPAKGDKFWKGMDIECMYFKFDYSSKSSKTAARYNITPKDYAQMQIYWGNDPVYKLANTLVSDIVEEGAFQVSSKHYYAACVGPGKEYGKKISFTYLDDKKVNVGNHIQGDAAAQQNGEENVNSVEESIENYINRIDYMPGKSVDDKILKSIEKGDLCSSILGDESETAKFISKVMGYIQIGTVFLVLVLGMVDLAGAVGSDEDGAFKKAGGRFGKRLIAAALVFLVPALVKIILSLVNNDTCNGGEVLDRIYNNMNQTESSK